MTDEEKIKEYMALIDAKLDRLTAAIEIILRLQKFGLMNQGASPEILELIHQQTLAEALDVSNNEKDTLERFLNALRKEGDLPIQ